MIEWKKISLDNGLALSQDTIKLEEVILDYS